MLTTVGWNDEVAARFAEYAANGYEAARVVLEHQHVYQVVTAQGERLARVSGRLRHHAASREAFPAVGDWVAIRSNRAEGEATIHAVLPRTSRFSRKVAGAVTEEQVVAANIDTVFIVTALDGDFNLRRLERYLVTARHGGASPVFVLNKADMCDAPDEYVRQVAEAMPDVPCHAISCRQQTGLDALRPYLVPGATVALLGSSGVGKSTLINRLAGDERQRTAEVRASDGRGRHTTSHRQLLTLPSGCLLIDTPGMRELQLWDSVASLDGTFDDITALADGCRFRDCGHRTEPGCAVRAAVDAGELPAARLDHYHRLQDELAFLAARQDPYLSQERKRRARILSRPLRSLKPRR